MQKVEGSNPFSRFRETLRGQSHPAPWRSGYAAACKAVYTGSTPVGAFPHEQRQSRMVERFAAYFKVSLNSRGIPLKPVVLWSDWRTSGARDSQQAVRPEFRRTRSHP